MSWLPDISDAPATLAFSKLLHVPHLPENADVVLASCIAFFVVQILSAIVSPRLCPQTFAKLSKSTKTDWDLHVVGWIHALIATPLSLYLILRPSSELVADPIFGYESTEASVIAISAGYFLWDLIISIYLLKQQGPSFLLHALACCFIFLKAFTPLLNGFTCHFLIWELSTVFLHPHWFLDKVDMTGSKFQLVNGAALLLSFFGARIAYGIYSTIKLWQALEDKRIDSSLRWGFRLANLALVGLNVSWFRLMLISVWKRVKVAEKKGVVDITGKKAT